MKLTLALLISLFALNARADILFEPMVSYEMGASNLEFTTAGQAIRGSASDKSSNTALNYGGRLGYIFSSGFWIAGDYSAASSGKSKFDAHDDTFSRTAMGGDIGIWHGRWNFWAGYNFSDKLEFHQASDDTMTEKVSGTSYKVGIGYMLFRHLVFNIEYTHRMYTAGDEESSDTVFANFDQYVSGFTQESYSAGFSFPF